MGAVGSGNICGMGWRALYARETDTSYRQKDIRIEGNTVRNAIFSSLTTDNNRLGITVSRTTNAYIYVNTMDGVDRGIMIGSEVVNNDGKPVAVTNNIVKNYDSYGILMHWPNLLVQDNTVYAGSRGGSIGIVIGGSQ